MFGWPPHVTRQQSWRDMRVLLEAHHEIKMARGEV